MRPKLNHSNLFEQAPGTRHTRAPDDVPDTLRDANGQSGIKLKQAASAPFARPADPISHALPDLDGFLAARLLRLEVTSSSASYEERMLLMLGRTLRAALARAGSYADQTTSDAATFEALLGETLRAVYAWVFGALDAIFLGEHVRPIPKRITRELAEQADAAATHARLEPSLLGLVGVLRDVRRACEQMSLASGRGEAS